MFASRENHHRARPILRQKGINPRGIFRRVGASKVASWRPCGTRTYTLFCYRPCLLRGGLLGRGFSVFLPSLHFFFVWGCWLVSGLLRLMDKIRTYNRQPNFMWCQRSVRSLDAGKPPQIPSTPVFLLFVEFRSLFSVGEGSSE